jgi:cytolysin (calcineurin-like family phosphatase)
VYEADGNHDRNRDWVVRDQIARRHGSRFYSFDFDDLHLVCLSEAPEDEGLAFLSKDLKALAPDVPVVIYLHYPLSGAFAEDNWFGRGDFRDRLYLALQGHEVIGIFHGHRHTSGAYRWRGYDVYSVGSPKHGWWSFLAVHVTDQQMTVASWNYELSAFWWWHRKPLSTSEGKAPVREVVGTLPLPAGRTRPDVRLDLDDAGAAPTSLR